MFAAALLALAAATQPPSFGIKDDKFVINGTIPIKLASGSLHYSRVVPELWEDRLQRLRALGLNSIKIVRAVELSCGRRGAL